MEQSDFFKIGYIARTHGLKGEVTMVLAMESPDLESIRSLFVQHNNQLVPHFVESASTRGSKAFVKLEDINNPDQAARLKGCSVFLPKKERPALKRGEFYADELLGFQITDIHAGVLGTVQDIAETGPAKHLVVVHRGKEVLIPVNG